MLATQAFADLTIARAGGPTESLRRQVLSHVDYLVAHSQSEPEAAELLGQMTGTKPAWSVARRQDAGVLGNAGWDGDEQPIRRRTREFVRHPDEFKRLRTGEAIAIEPTHKATGQLVRVWPAVEPERRSAPGRGSMRRIPREEHQGE